MTLVALVHRQEMRLILMKPIPATFLADTYPLPFPGRAEAGKILAGRLEAFANQSDAVVVAIPNDGVPVAAQVAALLNLPYRAGHSPAWCSRTKRTGDGFHWD